MRKVDDHVEGLPCVNGLEATLHRGGSGKAASDQVSGYAQSSSSRCRRKAVHRVEGAPHRNLNLDASPHIPMTGGSDLERSDVVLRKRCQRLRTDGPLLRSNDRSCHADQGGRARGW